MESSLSSTFLYPTDPSPDEATASSQIRKAKALAVNIPQYGRQLQAAATKWENTLAIAKEQGKKLAAAQSAPSSGITLTIGNVIYRAAVLTSVDGDFASIAHSSGVARLTIRQLTDNQIADLNLTSKIQRIVTEKEIKKHLLQKAEDEKAFLAEMAKMPSKFPLTGFCSALMIGDWLKRVKKLPSRFQRVSSSGVYRRSIL